MEKNCKMAEIYGIILLIILMVYCFLCVKKEGILFIFDYARLGFIIWTLALGLYDLQISNLYHPDIMVNFVGTFVIINFILLMKILPNDTNRLIDICKNIKLPKRGFLYALYFTLFLGLVSFLKNFNSGLLRFYISNKGMRASIELPYFFHAMVVVSICFYILFREEKKKRKKIIYLIFSAVTIFLEFTNLARGPLVFWLVGILFYELCKFIIRRGSYKVTLKQINIFILLFVVVIWGFGVIGDSRTSGIFGNTATVYYQMPNNIPSGFTWIYIYISSPLENLRYSLANDVINEYGFFNKLLYPIIKFIANILGQGANYKDYVNSLDSISPYLWNKVGLNTSTFAADAYLDANIIGIIVYLIIYDLIGIFLHKLIINKRINNISKLIIYPLILEITIWSVFTNSILGVTSIWSDVVFVLFWNFWNKLVLKK